MYLIQDFFVNIKGMNCNKEYLVLFNNIIFTSAIKYASKAKYYIT